MLLSMQRREASCNSSTLRGRTNQLAGPPILNQVNFASGAFSVTNCSQPTKGPVMRIIGADTELAFCVSTVPTFPCDGRAVLPPVHSTHPLIPGPRHKHFLLPWSQPNPHFQLHAA